MLRRKLEHKLRKTEWLRENSNNLLPSPFTLGGTQFNPGFTKRFTALKPGEKHRLLPTRASLRSPLLLRRPVFSRVLMAIKRTTRNQDLKGDVHTKTREEKDRVRGMQRFKIHTERSSYQSRQMLPYTNKVGNEAES